MKKNKIKFLSLFIGAFVFASLAGAPLANASVLYSQTVDSDSNVTSSGAITAEQWLDAPSGTMKSYQDKIDVSAFSSLTLYLSVQERASCSNGATLIHQYFDDMAYTTGVPITSTGIQTVTYTFASGITFNPTHCYAFLDGQNTGSGTWHYFGNNMGGTSSSFLDGDHTRALYYVVSDTVVPSIPDTTNHIVIENPVPYDVTSSTSVTISGKYYVDSSVTFSLGTFRGCSVYLEASDGLGGIVPTTIPVTCTVTDSLISWSTTTTLVTGRQYTATAQLLYGSVSDSAYWHVLYHSPSVLFNVVSSPVDDTTRYSDCGITALVGCFQNMLIFLFVPSNSSLTQFQTLTLAHSAPFSYIYDVPVLVSEVIHDSGGSGFSLSVPFMGGTPLTLISPTMIASVPYASTIKTLLGYILWFYTALTIYHLILKVHDNKK